MRRVNPCLGGAVWACGRKDRRGDMRRLIYGLVVLAVGLSLSWLALARAVHWGADRAAVVLAADGVDLRRADLRVSGYPSAIDARISDLALTGPQGRWAWHAPDLRLRADSWRPWDLQLDLPPLQQISWQGGTAQIASDAAQLRLRLRPDPALGLAQAGFMLTAVQLRHDAGWALGFGSASADLVQAGAGYDARLGLRDLDLPAPWRAMIDLRGVLGQALVQLDGRAQLRFAQPLDRHWPAGRAPVPSQIDLADVTLAWGDIGLRLTGDLRVDAAGVADGQLELRTAQWPLILQMLTNAGVIDADMARNATRLAAFWVAGDGMLTLPVQITGGVVAVAGFAVLALPPLR